MAEIINMDRLLIRVDGLEKEIEAAAAVGIAKGCLRIESGAAERCPVDTGNLRASITHELEGLTGQVGTNVEYAEHVEFGTSKAAAQPFLYPAFHAAEAAIIEDIRRAIHG